MRTVNGNWGAVVKELRKIIAEHTFIKPRALVEHFIIEMHGTDTFHPFDGEAERLMSRVLRGMPVRCDYRSCESLATWKDFKEQLTDAVWTWCIETEELIAEYYNNPWNFAPGYVQPAPITFSDWEKVANKIFARVHRAAMKGAK